VRLNYAMHSFPAQGATVRGTVTLAGHWSQAKHETYVGDTRAVYRHSVHAARDDLGVDGTDEDRIVRYAQRTSDKPAAAGEHPLHPRPDARARGQPVRRPAHLNRHAAPTRRVAAHPRRRRLTCRRPSQWGRSESTSPMSWNLCHRSGFSLAEDTRRCVNIVSFVRAGQQVPGDRGAVSVSARAGAQAGLFSLGARR
jgi:hypothetical protein